jgi:hypothetical protein
MMNSHRPMRAVIWSLRPNGVRTQYLYFYSRVALHFLDNDSIFWTRILCGFCFAIA